MEVQNSPDARPRGFFHRHSRKLFAVSAFLTMVAASPFLVFFGSTAVDALKDRSNRLSFDAAVWKASLSTSSPSDPIRLRMVDDLFRRHGLAGLTAEQVVALLGTPPKTEYFRDCQFVYWLGPERGIMSIDSEWLAVRLGPDRRVAEARIVRD